MSESNRKCTKCGFISLNKNDKFCIRCGAVLPKDSMIESVKSIPKDPKKFCSYCGVEIVDKPNVKFCKSCGKPISQISQISHIDQTQMQQNDSIPKERKIASESEFELDDSIGELLEQQPQNNKKETTTIKNQEKTEESVKIQVKTEEQKKIEAFSIPKLGSILNSSENKPEYQPLPNQPLIPKPSVGPVPSIIPNPIKTIKTPESISIPENIEVPKPIKETIKENIDPPEETNKNTNISPIKEELKPIEELHTENIREEPIQTATLSEPESKKEWKKVKIAVCPKCERHCRVVGVEILESENWTPLIEVKSLDNGKYLVECPGCGVFFIADINLAVPCYEERY